jgi:beta-N-acetylhexosaminidase
MTLEQKIGQSFFPAVFINDTEENILATEQLIKDYHIGGLTFFHSRASAATNYESKHKVVLNKNSYQKLKDLIKRYQKAAQTPLLICIDAEWGLAMRVENTSQYPYAITLGALPYDQEYLVFEVGKQIGLDLKSAGIHYNLAPLADINNNPKNPVIGYRSFGDNKEKVSRLAIQYCKGLSSVGVLNCLKHFPGHGNTDVDSHLGLPILNESKEALLQNEIFPFIKGIEAGVDSIMIGHLAVPSLNHGENVSATLSKSVIQDLLRNELGFDGLIISDALNMHAVSKLYQQKGELEWVAFDAGNDILCFAENIPEGIQMILQNASSKRINETYERIKKVKQNAGLFDNTFLNPSELDFEAATTLNQKIAEQSICLVQQTDLNLKSILFNPKTAFLSVNSTVDNPFFNTLATEIKINSFSLFSDNELVELKKMLDNFDTIIISLFVHQAKPTNLFGFNHEVIEFLNQLIRNKNTVLYNFGNPYALSLFSTAEKPQTIVQVNQSFDVFQKEAATQSLDFKCFNGVFPVQI